jgi:hypothetical protein
LQRVDSLQRAQRAKESFAKQFGHMYFLLTHAEASFLWRRRFSIIHARRSSKILNATEQSEHGLEVDFSSNPYKGARIYHAEGPIRQAP